MSGTPTITPGGVPPGSRVSRFASTRLLHEWAQLQPWMVPPIYELRLGPTPLSGNAGVLTPAIEAQLRVFNRYADMVGVTDTEIWVVEAKMQFDPGAISQVLHYRDLVYYTPYLKTYPSHLVVPMILVAIDDAVLHSRANAAGIRVSVYTPPWANLWVAKRYAGRQLLSGGG